MIDPLPGWSWDLRDTGVILTSEVGRIRYVERVQPLRTAARAIPLLAGWSSTARTIERMQTREHEYAALITDEGTLDGASARRAIGIVWLDDWYAIVDGVAREPRRFAALTETVRTLTLSDSHMRGLRRRRYPYDPPAGWRGLLVPPFHAYWLAPGYPRAGAYIAVLPAQPRAATYQDPRGFVAAISTLSSTSTEVQTRSCTVTTAQGLSGTQIEAEVGTATRVFVVLEDRAYAYSIMLEARTADVARYTETLRVLIDSITSLPTSAVVEMASLWPTD